MKEKGKPKSKVSEYLLDGLVFIFGCSAYAVSVDLFTAPNGIAPGGLTGISTVLNHLLGFPIGVMIIVLNIPLFIAGGWKIGWQFLTKTVIATVMMSVFVDLFSLFLPVYTENKLLAALYGGVCSGIALAVIFMRGGTTGGTDIAARLLYQRFPHMPMGRLIVILDAFIITLAAFAFNSLESGLYSMIVIFVSSTVIDNLLYGADKGKLMLVMSRNHEKIAEDILHRLGRGATLLEAEGAYTKKKTNVLLCAIRRQEISRFNAIVQENDPGAFMIVTEAGEILGEGFKKRGRL
ncbi:MAG: YitT family protein [Oscillospiraceae bacterium]|jgi:uncharacterized membrane-anchored protein YitT (DUF2179 family)|nr:YitT family protein [Oscillospiraceae bacterium]